MNEQRARQALAKFETALVNLENELTASAPGNITSRNSVLLTFILCFETFWKALRFVLLSGEGTEAASPKEVLRAAYQNGWLGNDDKFWLDMADDRNLIAHTYNEQQAIDIYGRSKGYTKALRSVYMLLAAKYPDFFNL